MEKSYDLRKIIDVILKEKWIIVLSIIFAILVSSIISWFILDEQYNSSAVVQVVAEVQDTGVMSNYVAAEFTYTVYMQRMQNVNKMEEAFAASGYPKFEIANLNIVNQLNTNLVEVTYKAASPKEAQEQLALILSETKADMNNAVKITLEQLEQTYMNESKALSGEIKQLMDKYNKLVVSNKLPEILTLQTISSSQFILTLTDEQTRVLAKLPGNLQNELLQLKAQIDSKSHEYENVLKKYQSVKTGLDSFKPDPFIRVILEPTLVKVPVSPNKVLNVLVGAVIGLMLGLMVVFSRLYLRKSKNEL